MAAKWILLQIVATILFSPSLQTLSDLRLCADPKCEVLISKAHTVSMYASIERDVMSFETNKEVLIYSKSAGTNLNLWGGMINGKRGYFPKRLIREFMILTKHLNYIVPTKEPVDESLIKVLISEEPVVVNNPKESIGENNQQQEIVNKVMEQTENDKKVLHQASDLNKVLEKTYSTTNDIHFSEDPKKLSEQALSDQSGGGALDITDKDYTTQPSIEETLTKVPPSVNNEQSIPQPESTTSFESSATSINNNQFIGNNQDSLQEKPSIPSDSLLHSVENSFPASVYTSPDNQDSIPEESSITLDNSKPSVEKSLLESDNIVPLANKSNIEFSHHLNSLQEKTIILPDSLEPSDQNIASSVDKPPVESSYVSIPSEIGSSNSEDLEKADVVESVRDNYSPVQQEFIQSPIIESSIIDYSKLESSTLFHSETVYTINPYPNMNSLVDQNDIQNDPDKKSKDANVVTDEMPASQEKLIETGLNSETIMKPNPSQVILDGTLIPVENFDHLPSYSEFHSEPSFSQENLKTEYVPNTQAFETKTSSYNEADEVETEVDVKNTNLISEEGNEDILTEDNDIAEEIEMKSEVDMKPEELEVKAEELEVKAEELEVKAEELEVKAEELEVKSSLEDSTTIVKTDQPTTSYSPSTTTASVMDEKEPEPIQPMGLFGTLTSFFTPSLETNTNKISDEPEKSHDLKEEELGGKNSHGMRNVESEIKKEKLESNIGDIYSNKVNEEHHKNGDLNQEKEFGQKYLPNIENKEKELDDLQKTEDKLNEDEEINRDEETDEDFYENKDIEVKNFNDNIKTSEVESDSELNEIGNPETKPALESTSLFSSNVNKENESLSSNILMDLDDMNGILNDSKISDDLTNVSPQVEEVSEGVWQRITHQYSNLLKHYCGLVFNIIPTDVTVITHVILESTFLSDKELLGFPIRRLFILGILAMFYFFIVLIAHKRQVKENLSKIVRISTAEKKAYDAEQLRESLEVEVEKNHRKLIRLEHRLMDEQNKFKSLQSDVSKLQAENNYLQETANGLQSQLEQQKESLNNLSFNMANKDEVSSTLQRKLQDAESVLMSLEKKSNELESRNCELRGELEQTIDENKHLLQSKNQLLKEAEVWNERVKEMSEQMMMLQQSEKDLQENLAYRENENEALKESLEQLQILEKDIDTDEESLLNGFQDKLKRLMDVSHVNAELRSTLEERDTIFQKLQMEIDSRKDLEDQLSIIKQEMDRLREGRVMAEQQCQEAQTKLSVLSNYFIEKETQLQKELGVKEAMHQQSESKFLTADQKAALIEEAMSNYRQQVEDLKNEITSVEKSFRTQVAVHEKKAHENWLAARTAERELKQAKQEASILRNKLTDIERRRELDHSLGLIKPHPTRLSNRNENLDSSGHLTDPDHSLAMPDSAPSPMNREHVLRESPRIFHPRPPLPPGDWRFLPSDRPLPPPPFMPPPFDRGMPPPPTLPFDRGMPPPPSLHPYELPPPPHIDRRLPPPPMERRFSPPYDRITPPRDHRSPPPPHDRRMLEGRIHQSERGTTPPLMPPYVRYGPLTPRGPPMGPPPPHIMGPRTPIPPLRPPPPDRREPPQPVPYTRSGGQIDSRTSPYTEDFLDDKKNRATTAV